MSPLFRMKRSAKDFFNHESTRYDDFVKGRDFVFPLQEKVNPLLKGRVLDVGSGGITDFRGGMFHLYIALDLSLGMLSGLQQDQRIKAVCADAIRLPFRSGSFDVVIYRAVLHHLNPEGEGLQEMENILGRVLLEARRVLGRDGKIVVIEPCLSVFFERVERWLASFIRLGTRLAGLPYVFLFSTGRLSLLLKAGGWTDLELMPIAGSGQAWDWITPVLGLPFLKIPRWLVPSQIYFIVGSTP